MSNNLTAKEGPRQRNNTPKNSRKLSRLSESEKEFYIPLGKKLRSARIAAVKNQAETAEALNVCMNHVSDLENAYAKMTVQELVAFCRLTNISPNQLLDYSEDSDESRPDDRTDTVPEIISRILMLDGNEIENFRSVLNLISEFQKSYVS